MYQDYHAYPRIKAFLQQWRCRNVLFNLDQSGHTLVNNETILDIMYSYPSVEIFYTFMIDPLPTFLNETNLELLKTRFKPVGLKSADIGMLDEIMSKNDWLGAAERVVFDAFHRCAPYVSPFVINNPNGWRYWLIHFANVYRARQVYNNILHDTASDQAHFGRSGLRMLSYDPRHEGALYLFDESGRASAKRQLLEDIPRLVMEAGDAMPVMDCYETICNVTPDHMDDVHAAVIESPDLEAITPAGGEWRKASTIGVNDIIKVKTQRSFFPMFRNARLRESNGGKG